MTLYQGQCHCGEIKFEFEAEALDAALMCNCSICIRKNAVMSKPYFSPEQFTLLSGQDKLARYQFGDLDVNHYFCQACGIHTFHDTKYDPDHFRINLNCVEGIDSRAIEATYFDGKNQL